VTSDGSRNIARLTVALQLPTDSWLVAMASDPAASQHPWEFARFLLSQETASAANYTFAPVRIAQTAAIATQVPVAVPSPTPTGPAGEVPPLPTTTAGGVTTLTLTATGQVPSGQPTVAVGLSFLVSAQFVLSESVTFDGGPLNLYGVQANSDHKGIVLDGNRAAVTARNADVVATLDNGPGPIQNPLTHSGRHPNLYDLDGVLFALIRALPLVVVWCLVQRTAPGRPATQRWTAVAATAGLAGAVIVGAGLLNTGIELEQRVEGSKLYTFMDGSLIVVAALVGVLIPVTAGHFRRQTATWEGSGADQATREPSRLARVATVVALIAGAVAVALATFTIIESEWLRWPTDHQWWRYGSAGLALAVIAFFLVFAAPGRHRLTVLLGTLVVVAAAWVNAAARSGIGLLPDLASTAPLLLSALAVLSVAEFGLAAGIGHPLDWRRGLHAGRRTKGSWSVHLLLAVASVLLVLPAGHLVFTGLNHAQNWYDTLNTLYWVGSLLSLVTMIVVVRTMYLWPRTGGTKAKVSMSDNRLLGVASFLLLLSPLTSWWFLPIPFAVSLALVWWLLLPQSAVATAEQLAGLTRDKQLSLIADFVDAAAARTALREERAKLFQPGEPPFDPAQVRTQAAKLRTSLASLSALPDGVVADPRISLERVCFGHDAGRNGWQRAKRGAAAAALIGLPWIVLVVHNDVRDALALSGPNRMSYLALWLPFDIGWWVVIGGVFGWSYPLLRGCNGLQKALSLLATLAIPILIGTVFPGPPTHRALSSAVETIGETASVLLFLGLGADLLLLKDTKYGYGIKELFQLRRLSGALTWATSLVVAVGAAITSIAVGGVTSALMYIAHAPVQPQPSPSPSATTMTPPSPTTSPSG
jgi:hypothetical protein